MCEQAVTLDIAQSQIPGLFCEKIRHYMVDRDTLGSCRSSEARAIALLANIQAVRDSSQ